MSDANATQVGGDHYRRTGDQMQHWDLAVHFGWDPFQYQITKYVMRWKYKHSTPEDRLKDLQKAAHFLQKYIECYKEYDTADQPIRARPSGELAAAHSNADWQVEGYYGDLTQHYRCRHCGVMVRAPSIAQADATHGDCAKPQGYVNQGD
jgi:hypothetical protein